jgi:hypothetical protein
MGRKLPAERPSAVGVRIAFIERPGDMPWPGRPKIFLVSLAGTRRQRLQKTGSYRNLLHLQHSAIAALLAQNHAPQFQANFKVTASVEAYSGSSQSLGMHKTSLKAWADLQPTLFLFLYWQSVPLSH